MYSFLLLLLYKTKVVKDKHKSRNNVWRLGGGTKWCNCLRPQIKKGLHLYKKIIYIHNIYLYILTTKFFLSTFISK